MQGNGVGKWLWPHGHGLEGRRGKRLSSCGKETVNTSDLMITVVDQFIPLKNHTVFGIGDRYLLQKEN